MKATEEDRDRLLPDKFQFHFAAETNDAPTLRTYLINGYDPGTVINFGRNKTTALLTAALHGHVDAVNVLLQFGADPKQTLTELNGVTATHNAAGIGSVETLKVLVENGANVDSSDGNNVTPLVIACGNGHVEVVNFLLAKGADINHQGGEEMVPYRIRRRLTALYLADDEKQDLKEPFSNNTPLMKACWKRKLECVQVLLQAGCDVLVRNHLGNTALHIASKTGNVEIIKCLLPYYRCILLKNGTGETPLLISVKKLFKPLDIVTWWRVSNQDIIHVMRNHFWTSVLLISVGGNGETRDQEMTEIISILLTLGTNFIAWSHDLEKFRVTLIRLAIATVSRLDLSALVFEEEELSSGMSSDFISWILVMTRSPRPLVHLARVAVRRCLTPDPASFSHLPLPKLLQDYVQLKTECSMDDLM